MVRFFARLRRGYGSHPLHLLALLGCFALAGYVVGQVVHQAAPIRMLVWFAAAVVGHDLVLFPLYALADRSLAATLDATLRRGVLPRAAVSPLNYLRIPAAGAGLLLLIFLPGIIRQGSATYHAATGQTQQPFLGRWLLITAGLFAISAVAYALRLRRHRRDHPPPR